MDNGASAALVHKKGRARGGQTGYKIGDGVTAYPQRAWPSPLDPPQPNSQGATRRSRQPAPFKSIGEGSTSLRDDETEHIRRVQIPQSQSEIRSLRLERKFKIQNSFKFIQIHSNSKFKIRNSKLQVQNSNSTSNSKFLKFQSPFQTQSLKCRSSRRTRAEGARDTPSGGGQSWRRESASPSLYLATAGPRAVLQLFPRR